MYVGHPGGAAPSPLRQLRADPLDEVAGGVLDSVRNDGGTVQVNTPTTVEVTALYAAAPLRFATPVP